MKIKIAEAHKNLLTPLIEGDPIICRATTLTLTLAALEVFSLNVIFNIINKTERTDGSSALIAIFGGASISCLVAFWQIFQIIRIYIKGFKISRSLFTEATTWIRILLGGMAAFYFITSSVRFNGYDLSDFKDMLEQVFQATLIAIMGGSLAYGLGVGHVAYAKILDLPDKTGNRFNLKKARSFSSPQFSPFLKRYTLTRKKKLHRTLPTSNKPRRSR